MERLKTASIPKPDFVSEVTLKTRPEMKVISLSGRGDPMKTFDEKLGKVFDWLESKNIEPAGPSLGIYHLNRDDVGVENVEWCACVPVNQSANAEGKLKFQVLPKAEVVSVTLTGGYNLIGQALRYMKAVSEVNGIKNKWPLTEIYHQEGKRPVTELQYFVERQRETQP